MEGRLPATLEGMNSQRNREQKGLKEDTLL
jgi:hypothetical protein